MISKKPREALLVCALALLFAPALSAKGFSYSYADLGYERVNGDHFDVNEAAVNASFARLNASVDHQTTNDWLLL